MSLAGLREAPRAAQRAPCPRQSGTPGQSLGIPMGKLVVVVVVTNLRFSHFRLTQREYFPLAEHSDVRGRSDPPCGAGQQRLRAAGRRGWKGNLWLPDAGLHPETASPKVSRRAPRHNCRRNSLFGKPSGAGHHALEAAAVTDSQRAGAKPVHSPLGHGAGNRDAAVRRCQVSAWGSGTFDGVRC